MVGGDTDMRRPLLQQAQQKAVNGYRRLGAIHRQALEHLGAGRQSVVASQVPRATASPPEGDDPLADLKEARSRAKEHLAELCGLPLPRWFKGSWLTMLFADRASIRDVILFPLLRPEAPVPPPSGTAES